MKVSIGGEHFEYDQNHKLMSEMLELEKATGIAYGEWEAGLAKGSAQSLGALAWLLWHRAGRDVPWEDIASGKVELNLAEMEFVSDEEPVAEVGPTVPPGTPPASPSTGRATSGRSAKSA